MSQEGLPFQECKKVATTENTTASKKQSTKKIPQVEKRFLRRRRRKKCGAHTFHRPTRHRRFVCTNAASDQLLNAMSRTARLTVIGGNSSCMSWYRNSLTVFSMGSRARKSDVQ